MRVILPLLVLGTGAALVLESLWELSQLQLMLDATAQSYFQLLHLLSPSQAPQLTPIIDSLFAAERTLRASLLIRATITFGLGLFLIGVGGYGIPAFHTTVESFGHWRFIQWLILPFVAQAMDFAGAYTFYSRSVAGNVENYNINYMFASRERNQALVQLITNGNPYQYVLQSLLVGGLVVGLFILATYLETRNRMNKNFRRTVIIVPFAVYLIGLLSAILAIRG